MPARRVISFSEKAVYDVYPSTSAAGESLVKARCYRSLRKNEEPRHLVVKMKMEIEQLWLRCTGRAREEAVDFCVFLSDTNEMCVDRIPFVDTYWSTQLLPKLKEFYYDYALRYLVQHFTVND